MLCRLMADSGNLFETVIVFVIFTRGAEVTHFTHFGPYFNNLSPWSEAHGAGALGHFRIHFC